MPFLDEQELASLHSEIHEANTKKDELEKELEETSTALKASRKSGKIRNILLSLLAGVAMAIALFIYKNTASSASSIDIAAIKKAEVSRVLDSINEATDTLDDDDSEPFDTADEQANSFDNDLDEVQNSIKRETIYSVQIGMFSKRKYPFLSKTFAGTTSNASIFKYSLGIFKTLREAQRFRRELVRIGFKDAFVASYIDGKRQTIEKPN